jgi:hypothetical protein
MEDDEPKPIKNDGVEFSIKFGQDYISPLFVIVECYDHKSYGRAKREYLKEFTKAERKIISKYYGKLYRWYLVTGLPIDGVAMKLETLNLLRRAANFFATI